MCRSLMPRISAACHQVIFSAIACNITSCTFHRPLHRGLRVRVHAPHGLSSSPPAKRTYHLLSQPDISCATDTSRRSSLTILLPTGKRPHSLEKGRRRGPERRSGITNGAPGRIPDSPLIYGHDRAKGLIHAGFHPANGG